MRLRKFIVSVVLMALVLTFASSVAYMLTKSRPQPPRRSVAERAWLVETVRVVPQDTLEWITGYGTINADVRAVLRAEVAAPVIELVNDIEPGDPVESGQLLVRLDDRQYVYDLHESQSRLRAHDAQLAQLDVEERNLLALLEIAQDDLLLNKEELDRVTALRATGDAPDTELRSIRLRYQVSLRGEQTIKNQLAMLTPQRLKLEADKSAEQARAERAQMDIDRCRIKAPFDGKIVEVSVDVGDKLMPGSQMLTLLDDSRVEAPIELAVSTMPRVKLDAPVELLVESMPDVRWYGKVARIAPQADQQNRTYRAYVEVDNAKQTMPLLPGFFVQAKVSGELLKNAMIAPRAAIVQDQVFVVKGHWTTMTRFPFMFLSTRAQPRTVRIQRTLGDRVVLAGGIEPGDVVITTNLDTLYDGAPVRIAHNGGTQGHGASLADKRSMRRTPQPASSNGDGL